MTRVWILPYTREYTYFFMISATWLQDNSKRQRGKGGRGAGGKIVETRFCHQPPYVAFYLLSLILLKCMGSMLILVQVKPKSRMYKVERLPDNAVVPLPGFSGKVSAMYRVFLKEPPVDGKANTALVKLLSDYFGKPVRILRGKGSRIKLMQVG